MACELTEAALVGGNPGWPQRDEAEEAVIIRLLETRA
jgi:hypothetical protein